MIGIRTGLILIAPLAMILAGFFFLPVMMMIPTSFREYMPGTGFVPGAWTLENYIRIITDDFYMEVILRNAGPRCFCDNSLSSSRLSARLFDR